MGTDPVKENGVVVNNGEESDDVGRRANELVNIVADAASSHA